MFNWYNVLKRHRVALAVAYFNDVGDARYQGRSKVRGEYRRDESAEKLCERFRDKNRMDIVEEFNKLKEEGGVQAY